MCKKGVEKPIYRNMEEGFVSKQGNDLWDYKVGNWKSNGKTGTVL